MKNILITGATGFVGRHFCRQLGRKPGHKVFGTYLHGHEGSVHLPAELIRADLSDRRAVFELIRRTRPDQVYHLAAISNPRESWISIDNTFACNTASAIYLMDALRLIVPRARFLFASTSQVYGHAWQSRHRVDEKDLLWPVSPYAASKAVSELACLDYVRKFGIHAVIARPFNHAGEGQSPQYVLSDWTRQIAKFEKSSTAGTLRVGNLSVKRDFLHVSDVIAAYQTIMNKGRKGGIYLVCSERPHRLHDLLEHMSDISYKRFRVATDRHKKSRRFDPAVMTGVATPLRRLGWRPTKSVYHAVQEMLDYWRREEGSK